MRKKKIKKINLEKIGVEYKRIVVVIGSGKKSTSNTIYLGKTVKQNKWKNKSKKKKIKKRFEID